MQSTPMQGLNFLEHRLIDLRLTRHGGFYRMIEAASDVELISDFQYWGEVGETTIADGVCYHVEKKMVYVKLY